MKVILLKSVPKVGKIDEIVDVADGFANHSLLPKKLAIPATAQAVQKLNLKKETNSKILQSKHAQLDNLVKSLHTEKWQLALPANEKGVLFSKISNKDIAQYLNLFKSIEIDPKIIELPEGFIKNLGKYSIKVKDNGYQSNFEVEIIKK